MSANAFNKRFKELVKGLSDTELGVIIGVTADTARKMRNGDIRSLKLQAALRLARNLNISPWYLGGESDFIASTQKPASAKTKLPAQRDKLTLIKDHMLILQEEIVELRSRVRRLENAIAKQHG